MRFFNKKEKIQQNKAESEKVLREYATLEIEELMERLDAERSGLTEEQAAERLDEYGENVITAGNNNTLLHRIREALINTFNIVLFVIAAIMLYLQDYLNVGIICSLILLSSLVAFIQGERSNSAARP